MNTTVDGRRGKRGEAPERRFRLHVLISDTCWTWTAARDREGYGTFSPSPKTKMNAHRFAFIAVAGPIPDGLMVLHTCDNPACVRNDDEGWYELNGILHPRRGHLWLGTHQDNMDDMVRKGRVRSPHSSATHCKHGHEFTEANTHFRTQGDSVHRICRACSRRRTAAYTARRGGNP